MTNPPGSFVWYELMTAQHDTARAFYRAVIGWEIMDGAGNAGAPFEYRQIVRGDSGCAGGVLTLSADMIAGGAKAGWMAYLGVADVDAAVAAILADGGRLLMPAMTIDVGTFAMVTDPQGAPIYVMAPKPPPGMADYASDVFSPDAEQRVGWNELLTDQLDAAKAFYAKHFGFEFNNEMDMGPMGKYCFIDHHGQVLGAAMTRPADWPAASWRFYFRIPDIDQAHAAVIAAGGTALSQPHQVPGGDWVFQARDPEGVFFGLVGKRKG